MSQPPSRVVCLEPLEVRSLLSATVLSEANVEQILAQAASQAHDKQAIVISDRDGAILGILAVGNATKLTISKAVARAQTAAYFESAGEAFTTRTARFIIQDHFPQPVANTPGGPLYGVEFSSLPGSDVTPGAGISGDPGGIPLFINGQAVGGIGVAGDGHDIAARQDFLSQPNAKIDNPKLEYFNGTEESDFDEAIALAGAQHFMAPKSIQADNIFVSGLRLPFTFNSPATGQPAQTFDELINSGTATLKRAGFIPSNVPAIRGSPGSPFAAATVAGVAGRYKNPNPTAADFGVISSGDAGVHLTFKDVDTIIANAVKQAEETRGAIRLPVGVAAQVHVAVVDRQGNVLGVFATGDATNFSYDIAVQKARTAVFFSDNSHAFSTRAIGFLSQRYFPPGISQDLTGPLFGLQNQLSTAANMKGPLKDGITIFPGGIPLYKNGVFVGAIGVSGDGVDQDDFISFNGTKGFRPDPSIESDSLSEDDAVSFLKDRLAVIDSDFDISQKFIDKVEKRLAIGLENVQLPYVKFPRNPLI